MAKEQFKLKKGELSAAWRDAHKAKDEFKGGFDEYEDGRYIVALTDADRGESKSSGRDQVMFEFTFLNGDYKGKTKRDYNGLDRAEAIPHLLRKIMQMGFDAPEDIDDLEGVLKKMIKERPKLRILLKTKGEFQNCYIDKVLEDGDLPEGIEEEAPAPAESRNSRSKVEKEKPEPEAEAPASAEEEEDIKEGMEVKVLDDNDKELGIGTIKEIDEPNAEVLVIMKETGKKKVVPADKLRLLPKEAPKAKGGLKLKK